MMTNKTILLTGATDGLGKLIARHLAAHGATLLLHGRNEAKGKALLEELSHVSTDASLSYHNADYASLQEVNTLCEGIISRKTPIDILINNVGIGRGKETGRRELSHDGYELRFAVNYLAHVLLTERLLPRLTPKGSAIINVASVGQDTIDFSNVMLEKRYEGYFAYKQSKTALIMYTFDLAERLKESGTAVNAVHPATLMNTKMVTEEWGHTLTTVEEGADAVEHLLTVRTTGEYYDGRRRARAIAQAYDSAARARLKELTWELLRHYL